MTDRPTNGRRDRASYIGAMAHLKTKQRDILNRFGRMENDLGDRLLSMFHGGKHDGDGKEAMTVPGCSAKIMMVMASLSNE